MQQLDAEADVALLVLGDVDHALAEAGQQLALREVVLDVVLAGLGERRLDDEVVHRHGARERGARAVAAQDVGDLVEQRERPSKAPRELGLGGAQRLGDRAVAALDDLVHEAVKEDRGWRASSTCWVARKYFCSSSGAASMNGARSSVTASSPWKNIE